MGPTDDDEVIGRAKGGVARAASLTKDRRKEIAQRAAVARWHKDMPWSEYPGTITIGEYELDCAVLNDRRRVLSQRSVNRALGRKHGGSEFRRQHAETGGRLPIFLIAENLQPFISNELRVVVNQPIIYHAAAGANLAHGIDASALPAVCDVWVRAFEAGALRKAQIPTAMRARALLKALQNVGIVALVDEATGYQAVRSKDDLRLILEAYISKELLPWTERFPEDFYKEMFRLRKWPFSSLQYDTKGPQGPRYAGKLTNELVYDQLPPGVRQELERLNPKMESGRRKFHNHRLLSGDIGNPHLEKQVAVVTALMRASTTWREFMKSFNRNFRPDRGEQVEMFDKEAAD